MFSHKGCVQKFCSFAREELLIEAPEASEREKAQNKRKPHLNLGREYLSDLKSFQCNRDCQRAA